MKSDIVVISWWSNCLGLKCLYNLCANSKGRRIYVIQVGKQPHLKEAFSAKLPEEVIELSIPEDHPAEHWAVCEWLVREQVVDSQGLWFFDHDFFILKNCDDWLKKMDDFFAKTKVVMAYPFKNLEYSITNPAFWMAPKKLPKSAPGFSPIPPSENFMAQRPYETRKPTGGLRRPEKDTMVACMEYLNQLSLVAQFRLYETKISPMPTPVFTHLGGLYMFTYLDFPDFLLPKIRELTKKMSALLKTCPAEWVDIEDPVLLKRIQSFRKDFAIKPIKT